MRRAKDLQWTCLALDKSTCGKHAGGVGDISKKHGCFSVEVCEALALREGLCLAKQLGISVGWAEVDAANVAAGVNSPEHCRGVACFVFNDIAGLCKDVGVSKCEAISRYGNGLAHNLASL
ncbi:hypothetical protein Q3G72_031689 [Acer saccharum]|nr:hypothetical protein Q3G72_031689 [Acer saccharum]